MKYFKTFGDFLKHLAELVSESELCSATKFINMAFKNPFSKCMHQYHDYQIPDHLYISLTITSTKAPMPVLAKSRVFVMLSHYDHWLVSKTVCLNHVRQLCAVLPVNIPSCTSPPLFSRRGKKWRAWQFGLYYTVVWDQCWLAACVSLHKLLRMQNFWTERVCIDLIAIAPLSSNTCFDSTVSDHFDVHCGFCTLLLFFGYLQKSLW